MLPLTTGRELRLPATGRLRTPVRFLSLDAGPESTLQERQAQPCCLLLSALQLVSRNTLSAISMASQVAGNPA